MGAVYDKYYRQVKEALSRKELDGTFDKYYEDTWNGEYYCWDDAWNKFIKDMAYDNSVTGYESGFFDDSSKAEKCIEGWMDDKELIRLLEKIGFTSLHFRGLKQAPADVADICIRCAMLMDVSDYLYSIRRIKGIEF